MPDTLDQLEKQLRQAAESRLYGEVQRLAVAYGKAAEAGLKALPPGDPEFTRIAHAVRETLDWSLIMVRASREGYAGELKRLATLNRYLHSVSNH